MKTINFFLRKRNVLKTFLITTLLATGLGSAWGENVTWEGDSSSRTAHISGTYQHLNLND